VLAPKAPVTREALKPVVRGVLIFVFVLLVVFVLVVLKIVIQKCSVTVWGDSEAVRRSRSRHCGHKGH
jgi:hypothetical protein